MDPKKDSRLPTPISAFGRNGDGSGVLAVTPADEMAGRAAAA
jgi:hypothetical protein